MPNSKNKTKKINPNKCLPQEKPYKTGFYEIDLVLDSIRDRLKRQNEIFFNPLLQFSFFPMYLLSELSNTFKEENDTSSILIVPFAESMGVPQQMILYISCASILALGTQFKFRFNPFNGLNETRDGVLQMVSGSVPPIRLGLTNEQQIRRLVKVTKFGLKVNQFLKTFGFPVLFLFIIITICSLNEFDLAMGIVNAILFTIGTIYVVEIIENIFLTILINCYYFKLKIN